MNKGMMLVFKWMLKNQAKQISIEDIKKDYSYRFWKWIIDIAEVFNEELKEPAKDLGKILAYRLEHDKEFREKVKKVLEETRKIEITD